MLRLPRDVTGLRPLEEEEEEKEVLPEEEEVEPQGTWRLNWPAPRTPVCLEDLDPEVREEEEEEEEAEGMHPTEGEEEEGAEHQDHRDRSQ